MRVLALALAFFVIGCSSSPPYEIISATAFRDFGDTPLNHTVYVGSDADFHYFKWNHGKSSGGWKVIRQEMPFNTEWPVGTRDAFMRHDLSNKWEPYGDSAQ